ncbi:MAG: VanZ family protein [Clostridia bacterium]|nr:VanZ family protein [Clostridia bacterium]
MIEITFLQLMAVISLLWLVCRGAVWLKNKRINLKREEQMLLVYVCVAVVVRITCFPAFRVDGRIQPLLLDTAQLAPRLNFVPFVYLFDYENMLLAMINLVGNILMFVPLGIVWPSVFKKLDAHWKVVLAGVGFTVLIEVFQLPFFERVTDIDDLILNSAGFILGYGIYLLATKKRRRYLFRKIEEQEIPRLFEIIASRVSWMDQVGIKQWNTTEYLTVYPMEYYEEKFRLGQVFVLEDKKKNKIVCGAVLMDKDARWKQEASALYLHNFASDISERGVGDVFLKRAEEYTRNAGKEFMRLDSDKDNRKLEKYYSSRGYVAVGSCVDGAYKGTLRQKKLRK